MAPDIAGKRLQLLKEAAPSVTRVAVLRRNPANPVMVSWWRETEAAAQVLGFMLRPFDVRQPDDLDSVLTAINRWSAHALVVMPDTMLLAERVRIADFALKNRLPTVHAPREEAVAGGLFSYGPSYTDLFQHAATSVDKILKGAKPADLPVKQPTKFELVINLKTAKALGLTIPSSVLARADEIIE
jgi:putative ABC transport system substrate-binding protein